MRRGQSKYLDADYEGAVEDFEKINDDNPYFAGAKHNNLGLCYYKRQCFDQAEEEYNKAIKYNSKSIKTVSCYNPGVLYGKESKYSIAKKFFRRCLNIDPLFSKANEALNKMNGMEQSEWYNWWFSHDFGKKVLGILLILSILSPLLIVAVIVEDAIFHKA